MKRRILIFVSLIAFTLSVVSAVPASNAAACNKYLLTFPAWYNGSVISDANCNIKAPNGGKGGITTFIWAIGLNVINAVLQLVAYISAGFIIYGGFIYLTNGGSPEKATSARKTILNAVIGLVISFLSVVIVTLVAGNIG